ncbi:hypothetical protein [Lentibacillus cibarius]|uniref:Plasmid segregation centromere-binding protein ParR n=1 Tax=Lentibacillus cibarius TaxID=2583219 RepID=A0A5S3QGC3_9BACI|nr:hypothetical protein [Lentibacillus cibarius]TMN20945.1 hypothetical protein FFL34_01585 [Lentibacillus cibarius]
MHTNWKKRYSFRLTSDDQVIYEYLEKLPANQRSEGIRKLLGIAVNSSQQGLEQQEMIDSLKKDMEILKENQQEMLRKLDNCNVSQASSQESTSNEVNEQTMHETANAFLTSFGFQEDD